MRVLRDGKAIWRGEFLSGESNMSHSIRNLEHYHFRYEMFRRPGDLHAYFFGAPCLSCAYNVKTQSGDQFEIDVPGFGRPLRNTVRSAGTAFRHSDALGIPGPPHCHYGASIHSDRDSQRR